MGFSTLYNDSHFEARQYIGVDLYSYVPDPDTEFIVEPWQVYKLPLGVSVDLGDNEKCELRPHNDTLADLGIRAVNTPQILLPDDSGEEIYLQIETLVQPRFIRGGEEEIVPHDTKLASAVVTNI